MECTLNDPWMDVDARSDIFEAVNLPQLDASCYCPNEYLRSAYLPEKFGEASTERGKEAIKRDSIGCLGKEIFDNRSWRKRDGESPLNEKRADSGVIQSPLPSPSIADEIRALRETATTLATKLHQFIDVLCDCWKCDTGTRQIESGYAGDSSGRSLSADETESITGTNSAPGGLKDDFESCNQRERQRHQSNEATPTEQSTEPASDDHWETEEDYFEESVETFINLECNERISPNSSIKDASVIEGDSCDVSECFGVKHNETFADVTPSAGDVQDAAVDMPEDTGSSRNKEHNHSAIDTTTVAVTYEEDAPVYAEYELHKSRDLRCDDYITDNRTEAVTIAGSEERLSDEHARFLQKTIKILTDSKATIVKSHLLEAATAASLSLRQDGNTRVCDTEIIYEIMRQQRLRGLVAISEKAARKRLARVRSKLRFLQRNTV